MEIKRLSQSGFEIIVTQKAEPVTLVVDPFDLKSKSIPEADILLLTEKKEKWNKVKGTPFLIAGPGEYEIKDVFIRGISALDKEKERVTIYAIEGEGLGLCHWGRLGQNELNSEQVEQIGDIDILFVPLAAQQRVSIKEILPLISQLEPKLIIPIEDADSRKLNQFLKELGIKSAEEQKKLKIKARDLVHQEKAEVVMLKA